MLRWAPGAHRLVAWEGGLALLDASVTDDQAERVWHAMRRDAALGTFLESLVEATGRGLLDIAPFAVAIVSEAGAHIAVRGPLRVVVQGANPVELVGEDVTTWEEKLVPGATAVELHSREGHARALPLVAGVADAAWAAWSAERDEPRPADPLHDGLTVADDSELAVAAPAVVAPVPQVLAALCDRNHPNPPQRAQCYACGARVGGQPRIMDRPQLGWLKITGGELVPLEGPVVAGRNPRAAAISTAEPARLVALPHRHVSSNHLAFLLEGWTVLVRDLGSSNGSYLRRHGKLPVRLPEHDLPLIPGDVIDLGHGVFINLDRIP